MYLEPNRTFYNEAFSRNMYIYIYILQIQKKRPALESHFNKVTGIYPATLLKERTSTQMFSGEFCNILKTPFLQNQNFINKIVKSPLRNRKKWKQLVRKTTTQAKQKLRHYLHQVFISFYYSKRSLFLFSLLPMIH